MVVILKKRKKNLLKICLTISGAIITDRRKFTTKITRYGISSFHFYRWDQFKVISGPVHHVQETASNFLRRPTRVENTADNAAIIQLQAANHHRLLGHVTLGVVECRK